MTVAAEKVKTECKDLQTFWNKRKDKFKEWYRLIQMVDELEQDKMESFVGNDPRAAFNLVRSMLDAKIPHRVASQELTRELLRPASLLESIYTAGWRDVGEVHRQRGRESLMYDFIGYLIATGWYAMFAQLMPDGKRFQVEVWNPATVFQDWDDTLVRVARILPMGAAKVNGMLKRNGWRVSQPITTPTFMFNLWEMDDNRKYPWDTVVVGNEIVKPKTKETRFNRIPVFTGPCGGLPDEGLIMDGEDWKAEIGQTSLATNEYMYKQFNKWWSFMMQLLRDTAQPITWERTSGGAVIIKPQDKFKRGAHFKLGPNDEIGFMSPPAIPIEIRSMQLDMEAGMQKGGPANALYGAVQQQLTSYVMSQIAASAHMIAKPFHRVIVNCLTDVDNFLLGMMRASGAKPYGQEFPKDLPVDVEMTADYELRVPGDAATRATYSRMLNPEFRITKRRVMEEFWPEISNPLDEMAKLRAEDAMNHPSYAVIALIQSYRQEAKLLEQAGDNEGARLFNKAADMAEAQLFQPGAEQEPGRGAPPQIEGAPRGLLE